MRKEIKPAGSLAIGPYSVAVDADGLVYTSGQIPVDSATGKLVSGGIAEQTKQCFANLFHILEAAGLTEADVQKVTVYLTDMGDFAAMNEVYGQQFSKPYPVRTTIGITALPMGAKVEIEMIAKS